MIYSSFGRCFLSFNLKKAAAQRLACWISSYPHDTLSDMQNIKFYTSIDCDKGLELEISNISLFHTLGELWFYTKTKLSYKGIKIYSFFWVVLTPKDIFMKYDIEIVEATSETILDIFEKNINNSWLKVTFVKQFPLQLKAAWSL